jgi:hypothetical protein
MVQRVTSIAAIFRNPLRNGDLQRAGDETRTRDIFLGKEVLYQLSYTRVLPIEGRNDASEARRIKKYLPAGDSCQCQLKKL